MQHSNVPPGHYVNKLTGLDMSDFDKVRLKSKDIRIRKRKSVRISFPGDPPVWTCTPSIPVDKEGEVTIVEKELAVHSLDMDGLNIFFAGDKVKRSVGLIEQRLTLGSLKADNLKATSAAHTQGRSEKVDRRRFRWDVIFLYCASAI